MLEDQQVQAEIDRLKTTIKALGDAIKTSVAQQLAAASTATGDIIDARVKALATDIAEVERDIEKLRVRQEKLEDNDSRQTIAIEGLLGADRQIKTQIETNTGKIQTITSRLNGTVEFGGTEAIPIEQLRSSVSGIKDQLGGSGDQLPYSEVRSSIANTKLLGKLMSWFISVFGIGGVLAVISVLTGYGKPADLLPTITAQSSKIELLSGENKRMEKLIDKLENRLNDLSQRTPASK